MASVNRATSGPAAGQRIGDYFLRNADGTPAALYDLLDRRGTAIGVNMAAGEVAAPEGWRRLSVGGPGLPGMDWIDEDGSAVAELAGDAGRRALVVVDGWGTVLAVAQDDTTPGPSFWPAPRQPIGELPPPVLIIPDVIGPDLRHQLIADFESRETIASTVRDDRDGRVERTLDRARKIRRDAPIHDAALHQAFMRRMSQAVVPRIHVALCYHFTRVEYLKISCYDAKSGGGHLVAHRDNTTPDVAHRRFAMTLLLNDAFEGGRLRFPEYAMTPISAPAGAAIIFSCGLLHRVTPVSSGARYAALAFLFNPREGPAHGAPPPHLGLGGTAPAR